MPPSPARAGINPTPCREELRYPPLSRVRRDKPWHKGPRQRTLSPPPRARINRWVGSSRPSRGRLSRAREDKPSPGFASLSQSRLPRTRGDKPVRNHEGPSFQNAFPAHAGINHALELSDRKRLPVPARADKPVDAAVGQAPKPLPPYAQGQTVPLEQSCRYTRILMDRQIPCVIGCCQVSCVMTAGKSLLRLVSCQHSCIHKSGWQKHHPPRAPRTRG